MKYGKECKTVEDLAEYVLDVMMNGSDELGVNDAFSFTDWLQNYLSEIAYGY